MHDTAIENARKFIEEFIRPGMTVIDIGSADINGSLRGNMPDNVQYRGVDVSPGPGVDVVLNDPYIIPLPDFSADIVLSTSAFEHIEFFWLTFLEMCRITKLGGMIYLCSPSKGPYHPVPQDCWRFYPDSAAALAKWARGNDYPVVIYRTYISIYSNPDLKEVDDPWEDWVAIFRRVE